MLDIPSAKWSKASTSINTSGIRQTKENVLKCIANWFSLMNHNYAIDNAAPPLLYGAFLNLLISLLRKITRIDHVRPQQVGQHPCLDQTSYGGPTSGPFPFCEHFQCSIRLICDIEICAQLGSLGQIFAAPSVLYIKPAPKSMPTTATTPDKHLRPSFTQNGDLELAKKRKKAEKDAWLKKLSRGSFCQPADLS
eukprot:6550459-Ditylum_brightwellii.AAC.1